MNPVLNRMEAATGLSIQDEIYKDMGFDVHTRKFGSGHVLESTNEVCINSLTDLLVKKGLSSEKARDVSIHSYDKDGSAALTGELLPFGDVYSIFSRLRGDDFYRYKFENSVLDWGGGVQGTCPSMQSPFWYNHGVYISI